MHVRSMIYVIITFALDGLALVNFTLTCILLSLVEPHCARLCFQFIAAFAADVGLSQAGMSGLAVLGLGLMA